MCFSEPVSFTAGSILLVGGAITTWKSLKINKNYLPVAMMPIMAGIQQISEGFVWMGMNSGNSDIVWWGAMVFILFSWLMWPTWIPFSIYFLEPENSKRKKPLLLFSLSGLVFGLILYIPHILNSGWINVAINNFSLAYEDTMLLDYLIPREATYAIYMFLIITPPLISSYFHMKLFGVMLIVIVAIVWVFLTYAYISFFCLLAGIATVHLMYIILANKCCLKCPKLFR